MNKLDPSLAGTERKHARSEAILGRIVPRRRFGRPEGFGWRTPVVVGLVALVLVARARAEEKGAEFFEKRIRPALSEHCYECHSGTSKKLRGNLRVDSRAALLQGGDTGPAIVPGKPEASLLYAAMAHRDKEVAMPPKKPKLPDAVLADFYRWIAENAPWPGEEAPAAPKKGEFNLAARKERLPWIWQTPRRENLPTVRKKDWPSGDADYFILAKLEQKGLAPAPAADDRTWLRRAHFAITGLPPTVEAIRAFLADRSPEARERVVDGLLASPHYGERWARHWMDLVRYAESRGHESDYIIANAHHYRDYLIRAFNADLPYNDFVTEHLAGDLVPQARLNPATGGNESALGTGWAFLGEEVHSPVDIRQDECERTDNKVDVLGKTFLGLTVGCARCHDHKFDAITARDYYALAGFVLSSSYRQVPFESMERNRAVALELEALRKEFAPKLARAAAEAAKAGVARAADYLEAAASVRREEKAGKAVALAVGESAKHAGLETNRLQAWVAALKKAEEQPANPLRPFARMASGAVDKSGAAPAALPANAVVVADYTVPGSTPWKADGPGFGVGPLSTGAFVFNTETNQPVLGVMAYGAARRDPFWKKFKTAPGNEDDSGSLGATARSGQMVRTPTVKLGVGKLHYLLRGKARVYAAVDSHLMVTGPLHSVLTTRFDTGNAAEPVWVTHDLGAYSGHRTHIEFGPEGENPLEILMVVEAADKPQFLPYQPRERPEENGASPAELAKAAQTRMEAARRALAEGNWNSTTRAADEAAMASWILQSRDLLASGGETQTPSVEAEFARECERLAKKARWQSKTAVAWFDGTGVEENILIRGSPQRPGAPAQRGLPVAFAGAAPITATDSSGRLELARQIVDPANPLASRVIVNRVWHHLFGRGIVATVDNFGWLGERPTHPELLDHLAWQFVHEDAWSLKRLVKRLVLSKTFAMASRPDDSRSEELDPANLLLHRMPVRRLEGEAVRDAMLVVSGRFDPTVGGSPVPVHLTEFVIGRGRPETSGPLDGAGRRSVYTGVKRNFLPTMMLAFDSPTPFSTVGRRNVTNVPAQSLVLMNDKFVYAQAEVWAARLLREFKEASPEERIRRMHETAYGRLPSAAETAECLHTLSELEEATGAGRDSAEVWRELCHALMNANDFIYLK